jgi:hypothetical protein
VPGGRCTRLLGTLVVVMCVGVLLRGCGHSCEGSFWLKLHAGQPEGVKLGQAGQHLRQTCRRQQAKGYIQT